MTEPTKKRYVVHDADGMIHYRATIPAFFAPTYAWPEGMSAVEVQDDQHYELTHFVRDGELTPMRSFELGIVDRTVGADGTSLLAITNVPAGTLVKIAGPITGEIVVNDGTLELTFVEPGDYTLSFSKRLYLPSTEVVHAV